MKSREDKMEETGVVCKIILKWGLTEIKNEVLDSIQLAYDRIRWLTVSIW
jgi:hypothetical protein